MCARGSFYSSNCSRRTWNLIRSTPFGEFSGMSLPWTLRWMQCIHDFWGMWPEEPVESDISFAEKSAMKGEASEACSKCLPHSPGLEVRQSTLPGAGLGLFTTRLYQDTDHICTYSGTVLSLR